MKKIVSKVSVLLSALVFTVAFSNTAKALDPTEYLESRTIKAQKEPVSHDWYDYKRGLFVAEQSKKYVLVNFYNKDDKFSQKLLKSYEDPEVKALLKEKFVTINVDGTSNYRIESNKNMVEKELLKKYEIEVYPTMAFLDYKGKQVSGQVKGYLPPDKLLVILNYISTESYKKTTLLAYERSFKKNSNNK
ncbi:MAG: thioredoxin fold domain-containing protein [Candidatus Sericytochromatia bacterium]